MRNGMEGEGEGEVEGMKRSKGGVEGLEVQRDGGDEWWEMETVWKLSAAFPNEMKGDRRKERGL